MSVQNINEMILNYFHHHRI